MACSSAVVGHLDDDQERDGALESLEERFRKQARRGGVGESGGCTDASVRLSTLLKVLSVASRLSSGAVHALPSPAVAVDCAGGCWHCATHMCTGAVRIPVHRVGHTAEVRPP